MPDNKKNISEDKSLTQADQIKQYLLKEFREVETALQSSFKLYRTPYEILPLKMWESFQVVNHPTSNNALSELAVSVDNEIGDIDTPLDFSYTNSLLSNAITNLQQLNYTSNSLDIALLQTIERLQVAIKNQISTSTTELTKQNHLIELSIEFNKKRIEVEKLLKKRNDLQNERDRVTPALNSGNDNIKFAAIKKFNELSKELKKLDDLIAEKPEEMIASKQELLEVIGNKKLTLSQIEKLIESTKNLSSLKEKQIENLEKLFQFTIDVSTNIKEVQENVKLENERRKQEEIKRREQEATNRKQEAERKAQEEIRRTQEELAKKEQEEARRKHEEALKQLLPEDAMQKLCNVIKEYSGKIKNDDKKINHIGFTLCDELEKFVNDRFGLNRSANEGNTLEHKYFLKLAAELKRIHRDPILSSEDRLRDVVLLLTEQFSKYKNSQLKTYLQDYLTLVTNKLTTLSNASVIKPAVKITPIPSDIDSLYALYGINPNVELDKGFTKLEDVPPPAKLKRSTNVNVIESKSTSRSGSINGNSVNTKSEPIYYGNDSYGRAIAAAEKQLNKSAEEASKKLDAAMNATTDAAYATATKAVDVAKNVFGWMGQFSGASALDAATKTASSATSLVSGLSSKKWW